ncbi:MAG TPA: TMEM175 family protein [Acidimicrobiales bacterium]|nr:TMEM175 family protein [Acidimicrobiales bacterium]
MTKGRIEAFSDGVFAIAATLLILRVSVDARGGALGEALTHAWPQYAAYLLSFAMIGTWWVNHHEYTCAIESVDRTLLFLNLGLLFFVAFLPFPTHLVAVHYHDAGLRAAVIVYAMTQSGAAIFGWLWWRHAATGRRLIAPSVDDRLVSRFSRETRSGPAFCLAGLLVALVDATAALAVIALALVFYIVGGAYLDRRYVR